MRNVGFIVLASMILVWANGCNLTGASSWQDRWDEALPEMGHRNWILVADAAYPAQSRASIETLATGRAQLEVLERVLASIDGQHHVTARVYLDAEIDFVSEEDAPGIDSYRSRLDTLLQGRPVQKVKHEALIAKLDEAAKTFRILVLKTDLVVPYTSVFLELDCGYWGPEKEERLRAKMGEK